MNRTEIQKQSKSPKLPTTICPGCGARWVVPGLIANDKYKCRSCGIIYIFIEPDVPGVIGKNVNSTNE